MISERELYKNLKEIRGKLESIKNIVDCTKDFEMINGMLLRLNTCPSPDNDFKKMIQDFLKASEEYKYNKRQILKFILDNAFYISTDFNLKKNKERIGNFTSKTLYRTALKIIKNARI